MSRGGGRGGRGGARSRPGVAVIAGQELAYGEEIREAINKKAQPTPLYPPYKPDPMQSMTEKEETQIAYFRSLRDRIHDGPLYTVMGDNARVRKAGSKGSASVWHFDAFEGMQTWSQRYTRPHNKLPNLAKRLYVLKFFPEELWSTLDPSQSTTGTSSKQKKPLLSDAARAKGLFGPGDDLDVSADKRNALDHSDDEEPGPIQPDDEAPEEEVDSEYGSDEDEMAGDYNAEQYFDDGGDDAGDDYDAGEAEGGEY